MLIHQYNEPLLSAHFSSLFSSRLPHRLTGHFQKREFQQASAGFEEAIKAEKPGSTRYTEIAFCWVNPLD